MFEKLIMRKSLLFTRFIRFSTCDQIAKYSVAVHKISPKQGPLLITCKRKNLDHYHGTVYDNLSEVPLASKGWTHNKSKGDYFTVLPVQDEIDQQRVSFRNLGVPKEIIEALKSQDIQEATEFQSRAIPIIQRGSHTLLAAETGCGKTISYLLPIIMEIAKVKHNLEYPIEHKESVFNSPKAMIIIPNRELAYQVGEMANILGERVGVNTKILVGGRTKKIMLNPEFEEIDIIVATPGVIGKLSSLGIYKLHGVRWTVFDEADTLMDDSFAERLEMLVKRTSKAQMILVSATLPRKLPDVLYPYQESMQKVSSPKLHKPLLNITQKFLRLIKTSKPTTLLQIAKTNKQPMLIFTNRNQTCNWLAMFLREHGVPCANINGDMNYAIRIDQWNQFVSGKVNILSATDVGSRGLNTIQVKHVLNYDFPLYAADYIHRIGRVGRIGSPQHCKVTNLVCSREEINLVQQIELSIRKNQPIPNVDGNISKIVQNMVLRRMKETGESSEI